MDIKGYWDAVLKQDEVRIREYFNDGAVIKWHDTNELFNVDEFIIANCEYPGTWDGVVESVKEVDDAVITVTNVYSDDKELSFHVVSFIELSNGKISCIDEYWGEDGLAPKWRIDKNIGKKIK